MGIRIAAVVVVSTLALAAQSALARQTWDRQEIEFAAADLARAARSLAEALESDPRIARGLQAGDADAEHLFTSLRRMRSSARRLARALGDNLSYEETLPVATEIRSQLRETEASGARLTTPDWMAERLEPVEQAFARMAPYYFD